jgi:biotin operon repressor
VFKDLEASDLSFDDLNTRVERIERTLKEILSWIKLANKPTLKSVLLQELDSDEKKKVYELTDGFRSQNDIESQTKVTRRMVGYYWQKWYSLGILVMSDQRKGRMQKIAQLDEVGITVTVTERDTDLIEFRPRYLKNILANERIFPERQQLADFAASVLRLEKSLIDNLTKEDLIEVIINTFEHSDRAMQSSFMQALESRTRDIQSSEFNKYFQAWEKQITK